MVDSLIEPLLKRSGEFGYLGQYLLDNQLNSARDVVKRYSRLGLVNKLVTLHGDVSNLAGRDILLPIAVTLIVSDYPMQLEISQAALFSLLRHSFDFSFVNMRHDIPSFNLDSNRKGYFRKLGSLAANNSGFRSFAYPKKSFRAAGIKINVRLGALCRSIARHYTTTKLGVLLSYMEPGTPSDVVTSYLLYAIALEQHMGVFAVQVAAAQIRQVDNAKGLSNALKALGCNTSFPGCMLVEAASLQGRACKPVNVAEEIWKRTTPEGVAQSVIPHTEDFETHISAILDAELGDTTLPDMEDWWTSRWLWCVNGAQNTASDSALGLHDVPKDGLGAQRFRRMASEEVRDNPVPNWDGNTSVSFSEKLECGKSRAIFACDTRSYFAFSYILGAVQRSWRNQRVLLDPGKGGYTGIARRILSGSGRGGVNLMLDYDDFNSHHSTQTMQALFRILCDKLRAPTWYRDLLVRSFDKLHITHEGYQKKILGTLMSGHRGTTFINSVLNAAYIRAALGGSRYDKMLSLHTGDDVYMRLDTFGECGEVLQRTASFGCRMNPAKQSIGFYRAEFLRMGINRQYAVGYLCRQLATLVAGNWASEAVPAEEELLRSLVSSTWGLVNRGFPRQSINLLAESMPVFRFVRKRLATGLLSGKTAFEGGPCISDDYRIRTTTLVSPQQEDFQQGADWGTHATRDYLTKHLSPVEVEAVSLGRANVTNLLIASSYKKGLKTVSRYVSRPPTFTPIMVRPIRGVIDVPTLSRRQYDRGVLVGYPILQLLKNSLDSDAIRHLLAIAGFDRNVDNPREYAFGRESDTSCISGVLPYSDASTYVKRTTCDTILVTYNIHL